MHLHDGAVSMPSSDRPKGLAAPVACSAAGSGVVRAAWLRILASRDTMP